MEKETIKENAEEEERRHQQPAKGKSTPKGMMWHKERVPNPEQRTPVDHDGKPFIWPGNIPLPGGIENGVGHPSLTRKLAPELLTKASKLS